MKSFFKLLLSLALFLSGSFCLFAQQDYVLGPGDRIRITVIGEPEMSTEAEISPQGIITYWVLGDIKVAGKTVSEFKEELTKILSEKYIKNPVVKIEVTQYRSKEVLIHGAVNYPGVYYLNENWTTLLKLISKAGGVTSNVGSFAYIIRGYMNRPVKLEKLMEEVKKAEEKEKAKKSQNQKSSRTEKQEDKHSKKKEPPLKRIKVNLKKLLIEGDLKEDKIIYGGDFVFISSIAYEELSKNFVWVEGAVRSPGKIPYQPGLTVLQAVLQAGGLNEYSAPNRTVIYRTNPDGTSKIIKVKLKKIRKGKAPDIPLKPGDRITVPQSIF